MVSQTNERALENCIETSLIQGSRYEKGNPADFDREFAIDREKFWRFLETTQPKELDKLRDREDSSKRSLRQKSKRAAMDDAYMLKVIAAALPEPSQNLEPSCQ